MSKVFISFSKDFEIAVRLKNSLEASGFDVWIYLEDIPPTVDWLKEIQKGIELADSFLFLLSPDSITSDTCQTEIDHAVQNGKRIIPLLIRKVDFKTVRPEVSRIQAISFEATGEFEQAFEKLLANINKDFPWVEFHTRLQEKALDWDRHNDDHGRLLRGKQLQEAEEKLAGAGTGKDPPPTDLQRSFIVASRRDVKRRILQMRIFGIVFFMVVIIVGIAVSILLDRTPAKVAVQGQVFEIRNRSNFRFLQQDVGSTIAVYVEPQRLIPDGEYQFILGTATDGVRPGSVLAYDMRGNLLWEYSVDQDPYDGPPGNFKIRKIIIDEILGDGEAQIIFTAQKSDWYPTDLVLLDAEGKPLGSYWNSGFIYDVLGQDFDGDNIKELVVSAVNNNLGILLVNDDTKHPLTVFVLSPGQDFSGQAFPDVIPGIPSGTEYNSWIAVFEPYVMTSLQVRILQEAGENLIEVVFDPQGGYIWMDKFGRIQRVGLSDYWRSQQGGQSPDDFICFLTRDSGGWYISAQIDEPLRCPWYVSD